MENTLEVRMPRKYVKWLIAGLIAIVFFITGYISGQAHGRDGMRYQNFQGRQSQGGNWNGGAMGGGSGSMPQGMPGMQGMASGTPAQQMPAQAPAAQ